MVFTKCFIFLFCLFLTIKLIEYQTIFTVFTWIGSCLFSLIFAWQLTNFFVKHIASYIISDVATHNKAVLVTGCDTGFGQLTAKTLNKHGFKVFAACLHSEGEGAKRLMGEALNPKRMIIVQMDVTKDEDVDKALEVVKSNLNSDEQLWGIVNNAGLCLGTFFEWTTFVKQFQDLFDVNVFGVVKVTRKFLPLLRHSKGRVVNIASVAGRITPPGLTSYSMTKHAMVAFSDGLRREIRRFGVHVSSIEPAFYETELFDTAPDLMNKAWMATSTAVKEAYTEKFYGDLVIRNARVQRLIASKQLEDVPKAVLRALVSRIKEPRYLVADGPQKPVYAITPLLPGEVQDLFFAF